MKPERDLFFPYLIFMKGMLVCDELAYKQLVILLSESSLNYFAIDLANGPFGLGTGWVLVRFRSLSGQLCSGRVWVKFGFGSLSSESCLGWVRFGSGSGHLRVPCSSRYGFGLGGVRARFVSSCLQ